MNTAAAKPPASNQTAGVAVLAIVMLLGSLGLSIVTVALPAMARDFALSVPQAQWIVLAYLLAVTATIVIAGRLGDLLGARPVLLAGLAIFSGASLLCAAAPAFELLLGARAIQGIGAAILMALPIAILRETVSRDRMGAAMGLMGTMSAIGTALGPSLGGLLITLSDWRLAFLTLAAGGSAILAVALRQIPALRAGGRITLGRIDIPGAFTLALALLAYSLAVTGARDGSGIVSGVLFASAVAGLALFVAIEKRQAMPLVAIPVLRDRAVASSLIMNLLVSSVMMATLVVGPFYLTYSLGLNDALVGLVMAAGPGTAALSGVPAGRITDRFGASRVLVFGLTQVVVGLVCFALMPNLIGVWGYVLSLILLTPGFQLFLAANNTAIMADAPEDQRGMISGLLGLSRNLGFMTGASVLAGFFAFTAGTRDIATAVPGTVAAAFSMTFLLAAGLAVVAILVTVMRRATAAPRDTQAKAI